MADLDAYLTDEEKTRRELVQRRFDQAEKHHHETFRQKGERFLRRYHNYVELKSEHASLDRPDRDRWTRSRVNELGHRITIPYAFATVETVLPRQFSNRPRMLILPRARSSEENVESVRFMIDAQQERIQYELVLQDIGKDGLMLGLGAQKSLWRTIKKPQKLLREGVYHPLIQQEAERTIFDGPVCERVDPFDFFWDPYADDINNPAAKSAEWVIHRTWRSLDYVLERMREKIWKPLNCQGGDEPNPEDVKPLASSQRYEQVHTERMRAHGYGNFDPGAGEVFEVLEYHGEGRVTTILGGQWVCMDVPNPYWHGEFPFQVYRPTKLPGKMVGIGEIEPIEPLCEELDELRSDRRNNAKMKLNAPLFYDETVVDIADVKFGAGWANPTRTKPQDAIWVANVGDIPHSGYQEEAALKGDIELASGISETVTGTDTVQHTATGAQLIQAAANIRIQNKTRRAEAELAKPGCRQWVALNQQKIRETQEIRIPAAPDEENPDRRWAWFELHPRQLWGEFDIECEGGATAPVNVPQQRADAQGKMALLQFPDVDRKALMLSILRDYGFKQPEAFMAADDQVPMATLQYLVEAHGVPEEAIQEAVQVGREQEEQQRGGGGQQQQAPGELAAA